ncbi:MAG: type II secretion system protein GspJ [Myxococcota bacterium]|nr:type II secretion system protein GspJ [Myxococcota bacterium]
MSAAPTRSRGFTLLEMLVVFAFTGALMAGAFQGYYQVNQSTAAAAARMQIEREASAVLDRVARDLQGSVLLVKPAELDPLSHPWLFLAESRGVSASAGANRLRFVTRAHRPRATAVHESDLAVVTYFSSRDEGDGVVLYRQITPRLPEELDRRFPSEGDEGVQALATLRAFGVRWLDEDGDWTEDWDSTTLERSGQLPVAAEITIGVEPWPGQDDEIERSLMVELPIRPLDLAAELERAQQNRVSDEEGDEDGELDEDEDCITVAECRAANPDAFELLITADPQLGSVIDSIADQCFSEFADQLPVAAEGCE